VSAAIVEIAEVSKAYGGLRPLRVARLSVAAGESVALVGFDQPSAETFVNLVTGATLPEQGEVRVFGRPTAGIADSDEWLAFVDRFGIVSERAVLLEAMTVVQNVAMPFTLEIEPPPDHVRERAAALAVEAGLAAEALEQAAGNLEPGARARVRLARALALDPAVLLIEHLSAGVAREAVASLGQAIRAAAARRNAAAITLTADPEFAKAVADRVLTLEPATGRLRDAGVLGWIKGRLG
jgi:ABC-type transporter Mla maintaining outer membrane lipid asymmetry ATPase subunit MlaF